MEGNYASFVRLHPERSITPTELASYLLDVKQDIRYDIKPK